jgi:hypothetical protein
VKCSHCAKMRADCDAAIRKRDAAKSELAIQREDMHHLNRLNDRRREVEEKLAEVTAERDDAICERDAALEILRSFVDAEETAKTSSRKSLGEYVDAMEQARELLAKP